MNTEDLEKRWSEKLSGYAEKLAGQGNDWNALSDKEQELAALWLLEVDMYDGGFLSFLCNYGESGYLYATRCLTRLRARDTLNLIEQQYGIVEQTREKLQLTGFCDVAIFLSDEDSETISQLDELYREDADNIVERTYKTYKSMLK